MKIPNRYEVGGQRIDVRMVERCDDNAVGMSHLCEGYIEIASVYGKDLKQSDDSKCNTFLHEVVHTILDTMGEDELGKNEKFVCTFSSFLCEVLTSAEYYVRDDLDQIEKQPKSNCHE